MFNEEKHIQMVNEVKRLYEQTPEGQITDSDTILKDIMDEVSFEEIGLSTDILSIYLNSKDRQSVENLFFTFTGVEFEEYLEKCISDTTRSKKNKRSLVAHHIIWDTDGEDVMLPSLVVIPDEILPSQYSLDPGEILDRISDWLSDTFEFRHKGYHLNSTGEVLRDYLKEKFATAIEEYDDESDFYSELINAGITVDHVRDYMGDETAEHMQQFCEGHGLI